MENSLSLEIKILFYNVGNVATEEVVYMLEGLGMETGIDLTKLIDAGQYISTTLGRPTGSKVSRAVLSKKC